MRTSESICSLAHSPEREDQREVRGGRTNLFSVCLSSSFPRFSPGLPVPSDRSRHRGRVWPGWIYHTLCLCILVSFRAPEMAMSQAWPRQYDPTEFYHPCLILSFVSVNSQFWPTFLFMCMIKENKCMSGRKNQQIGTKGNTISAL